jgi:uncharacterized protein (TIRG00374 family)
MQAPATRSGPSKDGPSRPGSWRQVWRIGRWLLGIGLAAFGLEALLGRRGELSGAANYLAHVSPPWVLLAVVAEASSYVAFALMQKRLLEAGGVSPKATSLTGMTLAATSIANSLPAGPAVASVYSFGRYRRYGADDLLAGWTIAAVFVAASVSLAIFAALGLALGGSAGESFGLVGVVIGVLVAALAMGAAFSRPRLLAYALDRLLGRVRRLLRRPPQWRAAEVEALEQRIGSFSLTPRRAGAAVGWALGNWVLDCGCLALSYAALGVVVPWRGLVLAYGAGQLAANLPITPGGLGVVEGSLTVALVAFGGVEVSTVAAVLLYRIISFWAELPVGWAVWGWGVLAERSRGASRFYAPKEATGDALEPFSGASADPLASGPDPGTPAGEVTSPLAGAPEEPTAL